MSTRPNAATVWLALMHAHAAVDRVAVNSIRDTGLCYTDFAILESLLHRGPLPVNGIATDIHLTSGSMTTAVDRLVGRDLVGRAPNPADKRSRLVELTTEGRVLIEESYARHAADLDAVMRDVLTDAEKADLFALLRKLEKGVKARTTD